MSLKVSFNLYYFSNSPLAWGRVDTACRNCEHLWTWQRAFINIYYYIQAKTELTHPKKNTFLSFRIDKPALFA